MTERSSLLEQPNNPDGHGNYGSPRDGTPTPFPSGLLPELQDLQSNAILKAQGHIPAMERSFSPFAALGLGFSITNSWVGYLSCFGQNLAYAGPNSVVFGLLAAVIVQWIISVGLYEVASCFPSSGGQYHFVFILAPKESRRFAAFVVGWINLIGWFVAVSSGISCVVASVSGLRAFWDSSLEVTPLQYYVTYVCTALLSVCPLFLSPRAIPRILQASLAFSVIGFLIVFAIVLILRQQAQPFSSLLNTTGISGWGTGTAWMLGLTNAMYPFSSTDAAIHIAEEMTQPEKRLPQVLNMTLAIGFATAFPLLVVMMLSMADSSAVVNATLPYAELVCQITGSKAITTFVIIWVTIALFSALIGEWVTCGRLAWAFARDGGLPFSSFFAQVSKDYHFPVRTTVLALICACCYGLLYLLSTTAFNSIVTSAVLFSNVSYCAPQVLVALRGRKNVLPEHAFDLRWFGHVCNCLSPVLVAVLAVLVCFPPELPVTRENINYTPVVIVGFISALFAWWIMAGKNFEGPKIDWEVLKNVKNT